MEDILSDNKIIVKIFGDEYPLAVTDDATRVSKVADLVDSRMNELAGSSSSFARDKVAILTALSLASELMEKNEQLGDSGTKFSDGVDDLILRLDKTIESFPINSN